MIGREELDERRLFHEATRVLEEYTEVHRRTVRQAALARSELLAAREELAELRLTLASVAHDLSNPLSAILGFTDLMAAQDLNETQRGYNERAAAAATAARSFVQDLMDVISHAAPPPPTEVDLRAVAGRVTQRQDTLASGRGVRVVLTATTEPGRCLVRGDETRLERLVENLVSNAVKFSPEHSCVRVSVIDDDFVELRVSDSGPGIAEGQLEQIFTPFHRTPGAAHIPGTGLGLMIVRQIALTHGGRVHAESVLGDGATFVVRLPRGTPTRPELGAAPTRTA